jgi:hypothetical protein
MLVTTHVRRTTLCTALTGLALVGAVPPAAAAPPEARGNHLEFDRFVETESFLSEGGEDFGCDLPFDVQFDHEATGTFRFGPRGAAGIPYVTTTVRGTDTWSANGHTLTNVFSIVDRDHKIVDLGDELLITVQAAGGGRTYVDGRLTFRNPGMNRFQVLIDHGGTPTDPSDDVFLEDLGVVKGSTGLNETEGRDFCADLALFLGPDQP